MPNQRRASQIFIDCQADAQLIADRDGVRGYKDRWQCISEAIAEKLQRAGIRVPDSLVYPPPRTKVIQIVGDNNKNIVQRAIEESPKYRPRNKRK